MATSLNYIATGGTSPATNPITTTAPNKTGALYYNPNTGRVEQQLYAGSNVYVPISNTTGGAPQVLGENTKKPSAANTAPADTGDSSQIDNSAYNNAAKQAASREAARVEAERLAEEQRQIDLTRAQLDSKESALRGLLNDYQTSEDTGNKQIEDSYNAQMQRGNNTYGEQFTQNDTARNNAFEKVDTQARTDFGRLRRQLGGGMVQGSSASLAARDAVARQSSTDRNQQTQTFGQNAQKIKSAQDQYTQGLNTEKELKRKSLLEGILNGRNDTNAQLADIAMQKSYLNGQNYDQIRASAAPDQAAIEANKAKMAGLSDGYNKAYNTVLQTPDLAQFTVDQEAINAAKQNGGTGEDQYSPFASFLKRKLNNQA